MKQTLFEAKYLRLVRDGRWEWVERVNSTGIVVVLAVTDDGRAVLVEQHRAAVGRRVLDLPAGLAGDEGEEALEAAAARELHEEAGYEAAVFERIVDVAPSPGLSAEVTTLFRARGLRKTGPGGGDASEGIAVHEVPVAELDAFIAGRLAKGVLADAKLYAGLYFLER